MSFKNPKNIKEFVGQCVVDHLKDRDKEIEHLRRGIELLQRRCARGDNITECVGCKRWLSQREYDYDTYGIRCDHLSTHLIPEIHHCCNMVCGECDNLCGKWVGTLGNRKWYCDEHSC